jgi:hypothetical protein
MYNATSVVTGKCWNCGQSGHSWRRCPTRQSDDIAVLKFKPPGTDDRITRMRPTNTAQKPDQRVAGSVSAVEQSITEVCSADTWTSLQIAATFFDAIRRSPTNTVAISDVVPDSIEKLSEHDPLMNLPRLFAVGNIYGIEFSCPFDTGAATSLLSLRVYNKIPNPPPLIPASNGFRTAAGTQLDVIGRALCSFTIANHTTMTPFHVVRVS